MRNNPILFFDTETSGFPNRNQSYKTNTQPWVVQLGIVLSTEDSIYMRTSLIIRSNGRKISKGAQDVHKISVEDTKKYGISEGTACYIFLEALLNSDLIVCHNVNFDRFMVAHMLHSNNFEAEAEYLMEYDAFCTMQTGTPICKLPKKGGGLKWPKLSELHIKLFGVDFEGAHDALADVEATRRCFYSLISKGG